MLTQGKVVLFYPPYDGPPLGAPLCLLALAASLRDAKFDVVMIDAAIEPDYLTRIECESVDALCIGISVLTGPMIRGAIEVACTTASATASAGTNAKFLVQGTLYPDVIESASPTGGPSVTIKTHHNVGGLKPGMRFSLIEPLRELFKDEVRNVGRELGLPEEMVGRHPFPGPGLAIRVLGAVSEPALHVLRQADAIYLEEIRAANLYDEIWQAFAVLLPIRSVGVMGDERTYDNVVALRAVTSTDGMTADWYAFPHDVMARISDRIIREVDGVNRVVYDVSSKPPATIEWE